MIFYISIQKMLHMGDKQRRLTPDTTLANHFANEFGYLFYLFIYLFSQSQNLTQHEQKVLIKL